MSQPLRPLAERKRRRPRSPELRGVAWESVDSSRSVRRLGPFDLVGCSRKRTRTGEGFFPNKGQDMMIWKNLFELPISLVLMKIRSIWLWAIYPHVQPFSPVIDVLIAGKMLLGNSPQNHRTSADAKMETLIFIYGSKKHIKKRFDYILSATICFELHSLLYVLKYLHIFT